MKGVLIFIIGIIVIGFVIFNPHFLNINQTILIANNNIPNTIQIEKAKTLTSASVEPICDNYQEIKHFENPVPVVWEAKFTGCLVSCYGAHFSRLPKGTEYKYPRFAGYYYPDTSGKYGLGKDDNGNWEGSQIPREFLENDQILRIYGRLTFIDADHPATVFENKCVPIIDIEKIETI